MTQFVQGLGYTDLQRAVERVYRTRKKRSQHFRSLNIHKVLLRACLEFTRRGHRIVNSVVLVRLRVAFRELDIVNQHLRIRMQGEIAALEMLIKYRKRRVFSWVPRLRSWLEDPGYVYWLGLLRSSLETSYALTGQLDSNPTSVGSESES